MESENPFWCGTNQYEARNSMEKIFKEVRTSLNQGETDDDAEVRTEIWSIEGDLISSSSRRTSSCSSTCRKKKDSQIHWNISTWPGPHTHANPDVSCNNSSNCQTWPFVASNMVRHSKGSSTEGRKNSIGRSRNRSSTMRESGEASVFFWSGGNARTHWKFLWKPQCSVSWRRWMWKQQWTRENFEVASLAIVDGQISRVEKDDSGVCAVFMDHQHHKWPQQKQWMTMQDHLTVMESSWRFIRMHSSQKWRTLRHFSTFRSQDVQMYGYVSTTQVAKVMVEHWRPCGPFWAKFVRSPTCWLLVGKTVRGSSIGTWKSAELGMSFCSSETRIVLNGFRGGWHQNAWKESRTWVLCRTNWWNWSILENQHHF